MISSLPRIRRPSGIHRLRILLLFALTLFFIFLPTLSRAEDRPVTLELEKKAEYWTLHGRVDLATQTYRQLLFLDPENRPALIGLAKEALERGDQILAEKYIRKLQRIDPQDPALPALSREKELGPEWGKEIAAAHRDNARHFFARALVHYQKAFGPYPPPPQYAVEYYNDLIHTIGGYKAALSQLRQLTNQYPDSLHYRLALGKILSYDPSHRWESLDILKPMAEESSSVSETATMAWRQVLLWEGTLPGNIMEMKAYLSQHHDRTVERLLRLAEKRALSTGPESRRAYRSLNEARFGQAAARFNQLVARDPGNASYWLGLSYAYLGLRRFAKADRSLDKARHLPLSADQTREGHFLSRQITFWRLLKQGRDDEDNGNFQNAIKKYQRASLLIPDQPDLLLAQARLSERQGKNSAAETYYGRAISQSPAYAAPWAGLLGLYGREGETQKALQSIESLTPPVRKALEEDPDFLINEGSIYFRTGHPRKAKAAVSAALGSHGNIPASRMLAWGWTLLNAGEIESVGILLSRLDRASGLTKKELESRQSLHRLRALREEQVLVGQKKFDIALSRMKAHAAHHPLDRFYKEREAAILEAQGRDKEAYALIRSLGPGSSISSTEAAVGVAMSTGHPIQAEVWLADAESRWPESIRITILRARFEQSEGHLARSRKILKKTLIHHPRDPRLLLALADNDRALGQFDKAEKNVELAMAALRTPGKPAPNHSFLLTQAQSAMDMIEKGKTEKTRGHLELMVGETAFTQYTQYYYAQVGDIIPLTNLGTYSVGNGKRESPILHAFLMGNAFSFEYHPTPTTASFLSQYYEGLTPAIGIRFPTSFGFWEGDVGWAVAQHFQTLTTPGTVTGLFLQTELLWNLLGGGLDLFANYTGYINYTYFQARYLTPAWESDTHRFSLNVGPEFITQGNSTYDAFQGGIALRLWLAPLHSSFVFDGGLLNSSAFPGIGGYEGVSWYFLY